MPPRYAYWTIIAGGLPTAFRAAEREELLPTPRPPASGSISSSGQTKRARYSFPSAVQDWSKKRAANAVLTMH